MNETGPDRRWVVHKFGGSSLADAACLKRVADIVEALGTCSRLPSGYNRDVQLIKAPLFRSIDVCGQVLGVLLHVLEGLRFRPGNIRLDPTIHATAQVNELVVREGMPFREAYRRLAEAISPRESGEDRE